MKKIRLTESELIRLVKIILEEQTLEIDKELKKKGYKFVENPTLLNVPQDVTKSLLKRLGWDSCSFYLKKSKSGDIVLVTDGVENIYFLVAPKEVINLIKGKSNVGNNGPYKYSDIEQFL